MTALIVFIYMLIACCVAANEAECNTPWPLAVLYGVLWIIILCLVAFFALRNAIKALGDESGG